MQRHHHTPGSPPTAGADRPPDALADPAVGAGPDARADKPATPPGRTSSPSAWSARIPVAILALIGCGISTYLALFQYHVLPQVWDPIFGNGSHKVLTSVISRALPVSDAALGAAAYLIEAAVELSAGTRRWHRRPWLVAFLGLIAAGLAVVGILLLIAQPALTGTFCTLCVCSAAISFTVAALVSREVLATIALQRHRRHAGYSFTQALMSTAEPARDALVDSR